MRSLLRVLVSLAGVVVSLSPLAAQQTSVPAEYRVVHRLLQEAYPEVRSQRMALTVTTSGNEIVVAVSEPREFLRRPAAPPPPTLIDARVTLSADRRVTGLTARGALLQEAKNAQLREVLSANPDWPEDQLRAWLRTAGAGQGPDRLLNTADKLDPVRWRSLLGDGLLAWDLRFQWRESAGAGRTTAKPGWTTRVSAVSAEQRPVNYLLRFEPFSGRLVEIREQ